MKKFLKILGCTAVVIIALIFVALLGLRVISPGKIVPLVKENGNPYMNGLVEIRTIEIGNVPQAMIIRSKDADKPVLLYLHGGPGSPEFPFIKYYKSDLEEFFTVCYWEQRGAGKSWSKDIPPETMTLDQFIEDTRQVTEYLQQRFGKEKIYLMGHSWGTLLGSHVIHRYPELYHAYFGIGQVGNQLESEKISYDFVLAEAKKRDDEKAVEKLEKIGRPPYDNPDEWLRGVMVERKYVAKYGGAIKEGNFMREAVSAIINCREYTVRDKFNYMKGNNETLKQMWQIVIDANLSNDIPTQQIPVYIFQGKNDYQTSYAMAREYFDNLQAPVKEFFTFENSAHSPIFEESARFEEILSGLL